MFDKDLHSFSHISEGEDFPEKQSIIIRAPHNILTIKIDDDQHFNYTRPEISR